MIAFKQPFGDRICTPRTYEGMFEEVPEAALERVTHPDITARKHGGNPASVSANESAENVKRWHHACILAELRSRGSNGMTAKEYVDWLEDFHRRNDGASWSLNMVSGRFSELKKKNLICECRAMGRRNGCAVIVLSIGGRGDARQVNRSYENRLRPRYTKEIQAMSGEEIKPVEPDAGTYDVKDLARMIKCSERHIRRMDADRVIPGRLEMGRLVRFAKRPVDAWLSGEAK